jgi:hypothetical protein
MTDVGMIEMCTEFRLSKALNVAIWKVQKENKVNVVFRKIVCKECKWMELAQVLGMEGSEMRQWVDEKWLNDG